MSRFGIGRWLLLVALLALINVPTVSGLLTDRRIATEGEQVTAQVEDAAERDGQYAVLLTFEPEVDPTGQRWDKRVDEVTFEQAREAGELEVTAVPGEAGAFAVPGEVGSSTGLWMTLLGNVLIAGWVVVTVRRRPPASEDESGAERQS